jgi:hypothetical protein
VTFRASALFFSPYQGSSVPAILSVGHHLGRIELAQPHAHPYVAPDVAFDIGFGEQLLFQGVLQRRGVLIEEHGDARLDAAHHRGRGSG